MSYRLAVLASHPIHYQAPLWRLLAADPSIELTVFFRSDMGLRPYHDSEFGQTIKWDVPLVEGYEHKFLKNIFELSGLLRRGRYDALLVHAWNSPAIWFAVWRARMLGIKTLLRSESPWNQEAEKSGPKSVLKRALLNIFFSAINGFLYIGEENRQLYLHYGIPESRLFFTPYAIENGRLLADAEQLRASCIKLRAKLGLTSYTVVFLSVGKLIEKKRHMELLQAYERCAAPEKALIIVGEGELRPVLEKYILEHKLSNVHLSGFAGQTEIAPYYVAADVFVLPSGSGETWGLVLNEALCFGLPVVVSDMVGSAKDLVRSGENGFTFPLGDIAAMSAVMSRLAEDKAMREKFGDASQMLVQEYSFENDVQGIKKALGSFIA